MTTAVFNLPKALNALLYLADKANNKDMMSLFKLLFFSEMEHLNVWGRSITGDRYIAMENGPVPSCLYDIVKAVRGDGYYRTDGEKFKKYFIVERWMFVTPKRQADTDELSMSEIKIFDQMIDKYRDYTPEQLSKASHGYAWNNTLRDHAISIEDIMKEFGAEQEYIDYVTGNVKTQKMLHAMA